MTTSTLWYFVSRAALFWVQAAEIVYKNIYILQCGAITRHDSTQTNLRPLSPVVYWPSCMLGQIPVGCRIGRSVMFLLAQFCLFIGPHHACQFGSTWDYGFVAWDWQKQRIGLLFSLFTGNCHLPGQEMAFLSHVISGDGVATNLAKVAMVRGWTTP